jgi:hypothetical protein
LHVLRIFLNRDGSGPTPLTNLRENGGFARPFVETYVVGTGVEVVFDPAEADRLVTLAIDGVHPRGKQVAP